MDDIKNWMEVDYTRGTAHLRPALGATYKLVYTRVKGTNDLEAKEADGLPFNFKPAEHIETIQNRP